MIRISHLSATSAIALCLATPVLADITAAEVWEDWKSTSAAFGQTLTAGNEDNSGGVLTLNDVAVTMDMPGEKIDGMIPNITLTELGNGTVEIRMSPEFEMTMMIDPPKDSDGEAVKTTIVIATPGMDTVVSGDAAAPIYDFTAPVMDLSVTEMIVDGSPVDMETAIGLTDLAGRYSIQGTGDRDHESQINAATLTIDISGSDPEDGGSTFALKTAYKAIETTSAGTAAGMGALGGDPAAAITPETRVTAMLRHGGGSTAVAVTDPETGDFTLDATTRSGQLDITIADGVIGYDAVGKGLNITVSGDQIPVPEVTAAMDEMAFGLTLPILKGEDVKDYGLLLNLSGLTVSDFLWSMIDPETVLPRDPATLLIELAGKARVLTDLTDTAALEAGASPGEVESLNVKNLRLAFAGADLTGSGDFTFDNSDTLTFGGFPAPDGKVDLKLTGGNGLLDKLVQLGVLPQDQAMGARMMMGLFAKPTGDDTMESQIEVKPDGSISANGQRLK